MSSSRLDQAIPDAREADRLAALRAVNILDTAPEEAFDRVVRLAQDLFDVPIALVSLVDEKRQWFKSRVGLDVRETPRDWAICNHTIQQDAPLVVANAAEDARFKDSPLVVGDPAIRFYAGAPIRDRQGHALGTVCVISPAPDRAFSKKDADSLAHLAGIVANEIELRHQLARATRHLGEKDQLIQEVHHQVANSLQIITDILELHAHQERSADVKLSLRNAASRIVAIGEVHQQLRRQAAADFANVHGYFSSLSRRLWHGIRPADGGGSIDVDIDSELAFRNDLLSRIGLAATALLMNAIRSGAVALYVSVQRQADTVVLAVGYDDGRPSPVGYNVDLAGTGFRMIRMLAGDRNVSADPADPRRIIVRFRN